VPLNVLLKPQEIAFHLRDSDAAAYFCFEGTPELPMADMGKAAFDEVDAAGIETILRGIFAGEAAQVERRIS